MTSVDHTGSSAANTDYTTACFKDALRQFGNIGLFADTHDWLVIDNPYRRPLRSRVPQALELR